jgi:hypothetical protein
LQTSFHYEDSTMKLVLAIGVLIAMLGGCAVVPLGYGYRDDGHYHRGDGYHHRDRYDGGGYGYYRRGGYDDHGQ